MKFIFFFFSYMWGTVKMSNQFFFFCFAHIEHILLIFMITFHSLIDCHYKTERTEQLNTNNLLDFMQLLGKKMMVKLSTIYFAVGLNMAARIDRNLWFCLHDVQCANNRWRSILRRDRRAVYFLHTNRLQKNSMKF